MEQKLEGQNNLDVGVGDIQQQRCCIQLETKKRIIIFSPSEKTECIQIKKYPGGFYLVIPRSF